MVSSPSRPVDAADALERLGRLSLRELSAEALLRTVAELADAVIPGSSETSVSLLLREGPITVVSTGPLAADLDERQHDGGSGPCVQAARTGRVVEMTDARTDGRWPDYLAHAVERGALGSLSIPLLVHEDDQVSGALNVYARAPGAFDEQSRATAARFGPYAAVAVGNLYASQRARELADDLQEAIERRATIDRAVRLLVQRHELAPDQALWRLVQVSRHTNRDVRSVADELARTGRSPGAPPSTVRTAGRR